MKGVNRSCNKWLRYFQAVVFLLSTLSPPAVVVGVGGVGKNFGDTQSLTAIENETVGKVRDKGGTLSSGGTFGNSIISGPLSSTHHHGGRHNSITSNELHNSYDFTIADEDDDNNHSYNEDDDEDEEDSSYDEYHDSFEQLNSTDTKDIEFIKEHDPIDQDSQEIPVIAKCCPHGEGLTLLGSCAKIKPHHKSHHEPKNEHNYWFPQTVYDNMAQKMVAANSSQWMIKISHKTECPEGERTEVIFDMKRFTIISDGSLYIYDHQKIVHPLEFCVDHELGKGIGRAVRACFTKDELCDDKRCLRKCCPAGAVSEVFMSDSSHPTDLRCQLSNLTSLHHFNHSNIVRSTPTCTDGTRLEAIEDYNISSDGDLVTPTFSASLLNYCLDYFVDRRNPETPTLKAMICFQKGDQDVIDASGLIVLPQSVAVVLGIAMIISAVCLAIAAIISWKLPELRSLHGKCQLSHLLTMFVLYFCLAIVQLTTKSIPQALCTFLGVVIHVCSLSSFLWLNLLCVNIYLTFRSLRPPLAARRDENRRLVFLCIYAWGIPFAFCMFLYIMGTSGRLDPMPSPQYGQLKCLISNREAEFAYLFGPVGVLLLCNGLLFCLTAQELLCGVWRLDNSDSINFRRKSMGIVVAKLGIVMGMGWILDVVSWAVGTKAVYMFYLADLFNSFQGVLISVILLWRKRVLEVLHLRKPSITKDETLTARPFLPKHSSINVVSNGDHDTSLVIVQDT